MLLPSEDHLSSQLHTFLEIFLFFIIFNTLNSITGIIECATGVLRSCNNHRFSVEMLYPSGLTLHLHKVCTFKTSSLLVIVLICKCFLRVESIFSCSFSFTFLQPLGISFFDSQRAYFTLFIFA